MRPGYISVNLSITSLYHFKINNNPRLSTDDSTMYSVLLRDVPVIANRQFLRSRPRTLSTDLTCIRSTSLICQKRMAVCGRTYDSLEVHGLLRIIIVMTRSHRRDRQRVNKDNYVYMDSFSLSVPVCWHVISRHRRPTATLCVVFSSSTT